MNFFAKDTVSESQEYLLLQADKLSLAFITGKSDSVMLRVDSAQSDYLQIAIKHARGHGYQYPIIKYIGYLSHSLKGMGPIVSMEMAMAEAAF